MIISTSSLQPFPSVTVRQIVKFPYILEGVVSYNDPHRLFTYLIDLSHLFHKFWGLGQTADHLRFIIKDNQMLTIARLSLINSVADMIRLVFKLIGIPPVYYM